MMVKPGAMAGELLRHLWREPATVLYPHEKVTLPEKFRGRLVFVPSKCIGCRMCMRDCPSGAISIRKVADGVFEADLDYSRCIFCAQCVDSCPKQALEAKAEIELAEVDRSRLKVTFTADGRASSAENADSEK